MKIHHLSDLHIKSSRLSDNKKIKDDLYELERTMAFDDILVVTGDIVDNGRSYEYEEAKRLLAPFKDRAVIAPGNHCMGPFGNLYSRRSRKRFWVLSDYLRCSERQGFIVLDSCKHTGHPFDFARGKIGFWQRQWLKIKLKFAKSPPVVIMHHDPYEKDWTLRLEDAKKVIKICDGKAKMVLYGHTHKDRTRIGKAGTMFSAADDFDDAGKAKVYKWKSD